MQLLTDRRTDRQTEPLVTLARCNINRRAIHCTNSQYLEQSTWISYPIYRDTDCL